MRRPTPARIPFLSLPSRRTLAVVALSTIAAAMVWGVTSRASEAATSLGSTTSVWIADSDLAPGSEIERGDVSAQEWPVAFVPRDAISDDPTGLSVRSEIAAGEAVVAERVAEHGTGPAAMLPSGWRGIVINSFEAAPPVIPGSLVDVVMAIDPELGSGGVLVHDAIVIHVDESGSSVTIAVPEYDVPTVAAAQFAGVVTLALSG